MYQPTRYKYVNSEKLKYPPQEIKVNSGNDQKLVAWLFRGMSAGKDPVRPTILFFHGNAQNLSAHFLSLYWILEEGYDFLIFDYPGYGGSEGEPTQTNTVDSGHLFFQWLKQNKPGPIVIFGQSLGGAVALQVAQQLTNDKAMCLVTVDSTFASYKQAARSTLAGTWFTWPLQWLGWLLISDTEAPQKNIKKISPTPVVVIHGKKDKVISYELGEEVYKMAGEPKYFWPIETGRHIESFQNKAQGKQLRKDFIEKIQKHCVRDRMGVVL